MSSRRPRHHPGELTAWFRVPAGNVVGIYQEPAEKIEPRPDSAGANLESFRTFTTAEAQHPSCELDISPWSRPDSRSVHGLPLSRMEAGNVPALPGSLDRLWVVVLADERHGLVSGSAVEHCHASQGGAGPSAATATGNLHPLRACAAPRFAERVLGVVAVGGQSKVRPTDPPYAPRHRRRVLVEQVEPEVRRAIWGRMAQAAATHAPARREDKHSRSGDVPGVHDRQTIGGDAEYGAGRRSSHGRVAKLSLNGRPRLPGRHRFRVFEHRPRVQTFDEDRNRDAFDRVEVDRRAKRHRVVSRLEESLGGVSGDQTASPMLLRKWHRALQRVPCSQVCGDLAVNGRPSGG